MRLENKTMQEHLRQEGIDCVPWYIAAGSMKGCWRLYKKGIKWNEELWNKLNALGFVDFQGNPLGMYSGSGGEFQTFVRHPQWTRLIGR
jgi:hypothetical protein